MYSQYFVERNKARKSENLSRFAQREIYTAQFILKKFDPLFSLQGKSVVDLGCGDRYLQPQIEQGGASYNGFDVEDADLLQDRVGMEDESVDLVLSYSVIEHLTDPSNFLQESYRILKPRGYMIIETPNWQYSYSSFYNDYTHVKPYTPASLSSLASDFNFEVLGCYPNLRCKPWFFYDNKVRFYLASSLPFRGFGGVFSFLRGRSTGIFLVGQKK